MSGHVGKKRTYYTIFAALAVLTVLTVAASFVEMGRFHIVVALAIAVTKALLVALFFMHLADSPRLTWVVALAGFAWLAILVALTFSDYLSRDWLGYPLSWPAGESTP